VTQAFKANKTASLSELLTLVVITQNQSDFLRRALQYYCTYPCVIMVLDSSAESDAGIEVDFPGVVYQHVPQFSNSALQGKLAYGVERVATPYMAFVAVDDFVLQDALTQCVEFLEEHPDYGVCHGYTLLYRSMGTQVNYYRRDKKVCEDYSFERAEDRVLSTLEQFIPPFYAVTRTALQRSWFGLLPPGMSVEWQEIGLACYLSLCTKMRILPVGYAVREASAADPEHYTAILPALSSTDPKSTAEREVFAEFLVSISTSVIGHDEEHARQFVLESLAALRECLCTRRSLAFELIIESAWKSPLTLPVRCFAPSQYVEMPFYNQAFFDQLTELEFLIGALPAGRVQLQALEGIWVEQEELLHTHGNDCAETITSRLWLALDSNPFNQRVINRLRQQLENLGEEDIAKDLFDWGLRLDAVSAPDRRSLLAATPSGRLLNWLEARNPNADEAESIAGYLATHQGGPQFGLLLLDLDNDMDKLQITLDSLAEGYCKAFKIVVFTTGELPAATSMSNTLHFIKVSETNYVDKLNQVARQSSCDWILLAEAGDQFTATGLLQASLELTAAPECRAVSTDDIQRQANGAWVDAFRPGFNLDLLQSLPALMARHWLIRRDVLVDAGGYSADFTKALEFDLLLRVIEQGGLAWLAHLDEPLLICEAPVLEENPHERQALIRHLATRGYKAQVSSVQPGTYQIDYRHDERPLVSIILQSQDNLPLLQRCLVNVLQRTRYTRYEVLIADNQSHSPEVMAWLDRQEQQGGRVRVLRSDQRLSASALHNAACLEAKGEYLILLAAESEVVNPNWIESLLNQAQRPEVGVVGAKLVDRDGCVTQAGLILGMQGGVGSAFVGEPKEAEGYLHRLVVEQNYSAVSAACLMVRKELYESVGGLDEAHFSEAFSDVDLCLKIGQAGYLTVWTPQVQIIHPGNLPESSQALEALREKWAGPFQHDQAYNKNLALTGKGFTLGTPASVNWTQLLG